MCIRVSVFVDELADSQFLLCVLRSEIHCAFKVHRVCACWLRLHVFFFLPLEQRPLSLRVVCFCIWNWASFLCLLARFMLSLDYINLFESPFGGVGGCIRGWVFAEVKW